MVNEERRRKERISVFIIKKFPAPADLSFRCLMKGNYGNRKPDLKLKSDSDLDGY